MKVGNKRKDDMMSGKSNERKTGTTDKAVMKKADDLLGIGKYIDGLCSFIKKCDTPTTIAVQGDWGSGKTSIMSMVRDELGSEESDKANIISIWFDTWKFSQFYKEDELAIVFWSYLYKEILKYSSPIEGQIRNLMERFKSTLVCALGVAVSKETKVEGVKDIIDTFFEKKDTPIDMIGRLKEDFQNVINELVKDKENGRVVIFIDDLDRIHPARAVELLEVIKIFMDCENCIFVLAVDYEVVSLGIKEKYSGILDEQKGRKFFDKIIQVPFKVPVSLYSIDQYVQKILDRMGISDGDAKGYRNIINTSVGCNPRAMKRVFNAYSLLINVYDNKDYNKLLLFSCLCMQLVYEDVYDCIVEFLKEDADQEKKVISFLGSVFEDVSDDWETKSFGEFDSILKRAEDSGTYTKQEVHAFLQEFNQVLRGNQNEVTPKELEELRKIFEMTSVTSSEGKKGIRYGKILDKDFTDHTLDEDEIESFNGCVINQYQIGQGESVQNDKISFADLLVDAIAYAYQKNPEKFMQMKKAVEEGSGEGKLLKNLFQYEDTTNKKVPGTNFSVGTYSNNDTKVKQIRKVYEKLGLDVKEINISMKLAHRKELEIE